MVKMLVTPSGNDGLSVFLATVLGLCLFSTNVIHATERYVFVHEHVLGTTLEIQLESRSPLAAERAESRVLAEIERLAQLFSSYDASSELRRWQLRPHQDTKLSAELTQLLADCEHWHRLSGGVFHPGTKSLDQIWRMAEERQQLPEESELIAAVAGLRKLPWQKTTASQKTRYLGGSAISLDALAKGVIIDAACAAAMEDSQQIRGVLISIGGDLRVCGTLDQPVEITDPANDAENSAPWTTLQIQERAVATSGNYRRGYQILGQKYSHIFDPRTGRPVHKIASATVIAETAATADALATIMCVLTPAESQQLADSVGNIDFLLIQKDGQSIKSRDWQRWESAPHLEEMPSLAAVQSDAVAPAETPLELVVNFELARPTGTRYRRPYVAIWLENADDFPVRTAVLWMQTQEPGPRWHRELLRWYRHDAVRRLTDKSSLISTVSGATRGPGKYRAVFDGKDDSGQRLADGDYTLFIEVAREHGTYQLIRHPVTLGPRPAPVKELKGNAEVSSATVEYRRPTSKGLPATKSPQN